MLSSNSSKSESVSSLSGSQDNKRPLNSSHAESSASLNDTFLDCSEKRHKPTDKCQIHGKNSTKSDEPLHDIIRKWQLSDLTKCVYDNAVNAVLNSVYGCPNSDTIDELTATPHNSTFENEAVLMAIQKKGLKQQDSPCEPPMTNSTDNHDQLSPNQESYTHHPEDQKDLSDNNVDFLPSLVTNDENQELNFENNFMTTAVSAAIEQKGLSMYHV